MRDRRENVIADRCALKSQRNIRLTNHSRQIGPRRAHYCRGNFGITCHETSAIRRRHISGTMRGERLNRIGCATWNDDTFRWNHRSRVSGDTSARRWYSLESQVFFSFEPSASTWPTSLPSSPLFRGSIELTKGNIKLNYPGPWFRPAENLKCASRCQIFSARSIYSLCHREPTRFSASRIRILKIISFSYGNRESNHIRRTYIARTCLPKEFQGSRILSKGFCFRESHTRTYIFIYIRTACRGSIVLYSRRKQKADNDEKRIGMPHSPRN